ncbi:cytochrome P450, partial [Lepidopterella palustris CBS 459.81]
LRVAHEDTSLPIGGGPSGDKPVAVLEGTQCLYAVLSMRKWTDIWGPHAAEWRPERWENYSPDMWDFIPFDYGPRVCLGRVFGMQQVEYALVRIYQEFSRIEPLTMERQRVKVELNTKMATPCLFTFHLREKSILVEKVNA